MRFRSATDVVTVNGVAPAAFVLAGEGSARLPANDEVTPLATGELVRVCRRWSRRRWGRGRHLAGSSAGADLLVDVL